MASDHQVRIQLSTEDANLQLPQDTGAILVPTAVGKAQLSSLVNQILAPPQSISFDFFVDGYPLRTSLEQWLVSHAVSTESLLAVEFSPAQQPPQHQASFPHDDCIGAVDLLSSSTPVGQAHAYSSGRDRILSAGFDGCVRVWNTSGVALATSQGAGLPDEFGNRALPDGRLPFLQTAKFLSPKSIVASGWQMYLRLWDYGEDDEALGKGSATLNPSLDLHGHTLPVNNLDIDPKSGRMLSASDDATAKLWTSDPDAAPDAEHALLPSALSHKRRKLSQSSAPPSRGAVATLSSHSAPIKTAIFHPKDPTAAYTASTDSAVLTWDLETSKAVSSRTPGGLHSPLRALCALPELGLLAAGAIDRRILLIDPREGAVRSNVGCLRGHRNVISSLAAEPMGSYGLASGSYDGCVRIWDVRVARDSVTGTDGKGGKSSHFKIPRRSVGDGCDRVEGGEGVKVFGLAWDRDIGLVSVGEDKQLQIDRISRATS